MKTMLTTYPAIFCKSDRGMYAVLFPDFGCATCGDNYVDAMKMAIDCMAGQVHSMQRDKAELPKPSKPSQALLERECGKVGANPIQACWQDVSVDVGAYARQHFKESKA